MATRRAPAAPPPPSPERHVKLRLIVDEQHDALVLRRALARARVSVWVATANVKELRLEAEGGPRRRYESVLAVFDRLAARGVELRLLHAGTPSRAFAAELARRPRLVAGGLAMRQCPRVHLKIIAVDGADLYLGSANFTGAGLGAKNPHRRNFELGVQTDDDLMLDAVQARFDRIWSGGECKRCRLRDVCPRPLDTL